MRRPWLAALIVGALAMTGFVFRDQVGSVGSATVDAVAGWSTRLRDVAAAEPRTEVGLRSREGESASVLMTLGSTEDDAAFALLVADPNGPPILMLLPQDLLVAVPGFGEFRLVDALIFDGAGLVALSITNQFGIRIDSVAALPAGAVARGLEAPVTVSLPVALFEADGDSIVRTLPDGEVDVGPEMAEVLLVRQGAGDVFEWIQRQGAAWQGILDGIAADPRIADRITSDGGPGGPDAADLLVTIAGDPETRIATVPVTRADSAGGIDALVPTRGQIDAFLLERLDHLLLRPGGRPRIEILNGNGRIGTTASVAAILIRAGYRVLRTDNADNFGHEQTLVIAQGDHAEAAAREIVELLGLGQLFLEVRAPSGVVDVSIIVGHDIPSGEG